VLGQPFHRNGDFAAVEYAGGEEPGDVQFRQHQVRVDDAAAPWVHAQRSGDVEGSEDAVLFGGERGSGEAAAIASGSARSAAGENIGRISWGSSRSIRRSLIPCKFLNSLCLSLRPGGG
jgi:hypothetical protein